jgi:hypothetical protein
MARRGRRSLAGDVEPSTSATKGATATSPRGRILRVAGSPHTIAMLGFPTMYPNAEGKTLVDTMILSYLVQVLAPNYSPTGEPLDDERIATLRLHFYGVVLGVGKVAIREMGRTRDVLHREEIDRLIAILLEEPELPPAAGPRMEERARELMRVHPHEADCLVVAEAELLGADCLITFDKRMRNSLDGVATVEILFPTQLWARLGIPRGTPPKIRPHRRNPLNDEKFWRWEAETI